MEVQPARPESGANRVLSHLTSDAGSPPRTGNKPQLAKDWGYRPGPGTRKTESAYLRYEHRVQASGYNEKYHAGEAWAGLARDSRDVRKRHEMSSEPCKPVTL